MDIFLSQIFFIILFFVIVFCHNAYITPAQSKEYMPVFIGTITSVIKGVLDEEWDEDLGGDAWAKLLSYIGGMLIRNLSEFTGKVHMIRKSWATITQIQGQGTTGASHRSEHEDEDSDEDADATERGKKGKGADGSVNFGESLYFNLGVMSPEIAALFKRPKDQLAPMFGAGFASLTVLISDINTVRWGVVAFQFDKSCSAKTIFFFEFFCLSCPISQKN